MRAIALSFGLAVLAVGASAEAASAHVAYVTSYRPVTHYVRRTVVVRERVWRPVRHRVYYRSYSPPVVYRSYAPAYYGYAPPPYRRYVAAYPYPAYPIHHRHWWRERAHERWEWEHRRWDY
jgi:hypothetical protein